MHFRGFGGGEGVSRVIELGESDDARSGKKPLNIYMRTAAFLLQMAKPAL